MQYVLHTMRAPPAAQCFANMAVRPFQQQNFSSSFISLESGGSEYQGPERIYNFIKQNAVGSLLGCSDVKNLGCSHNKE